MPLYFSNFSEKDVPQSESLYLAGFAVCDKYGDLWEVDVAFVDVMVRHLVGYESGSLPSSVLAQLQEQGRFRSSALQIRSLAAEQGLMKICVMVSVA